jgi:serine/threonine protein phosphatase PrpC
VVANVGDARAILCLDDGRVKQLTEVHRADNPLEARRVKARGGRVVCSEETGVCRVDGQLMPTRCASSTSCDPSLSVQQI